METNKISENSLLQKYSFYTYYAVKVGDFFEIFCFVGGKICGVFRMCFFF
jgi:hypothetical protein